MVDALRSHWAQHENRYPQRFELTDGALRELNETRKLVNQSMAYTLPEGWESTFLGVPLVGGSPSNALVAVNGDTQPLISA